MSRSNGSTSSSVRWSLLAIQLYDRPLSSRPKCMKAVLIVIATLDAHFRRTFKLFSSSMQATSAPSS
jgi:hypothetical protein